MTASEDRPWSRRVPSDDGDAEGGRPTPLSPGSAAEPLMYQTVQRVPGSEGQFRPRRASTERREEPELPPTEALPVQDVPRYRPRDFSPEGRRAVPSWAPSAGAPDAPLSERLDYHTLTRAEVRAAAERYSSTGATGADSGADASGAAAPGTGSASTAHAGSASGAGGAADGTAPSGPMSTPDQPLTRRQLRALREAQEAERGTAESGDASAASGAEMDAPSGDRPAARPWAPVFYGEPVRADETDADESAADETAADETTADEAAAAETPAGETSTEQPSDEQTPSWAGSAPATFAIPVISDAELAAGRLDAPASAPESPDGAADEPTPAAFPLRFSSPAIPEPSTPESSTPESSTPEPVSAAADGAPNRSLDDWVAGLYGEQPRADEQPLDLVEPPEPERWSGEGEPEGPSVLGDLFAPPSQRDGADSADGSRADTTDAGGPSADVSAPAPRPVTDPLEFLDAAPSAADRVDLPAPGSSAQPTVVGEPPVEPPGSRAEDEVIPVEATDAAQSDSAEVHPVIIDADPLPAEPLPSPSRPETPSGGAVTSTGAWSAHAAADDSQADVASGRDVGGGHGVVTTNALVLPSIPSPEFSGPLTTTGEIVVTGSIDLPRSLSSTGAHPTQLDQSSLDHELDPGDQQVVSVDSQPVRAIKAVSTHTSTRGMMTSTKPHGNRGLTVLIIVSGSLAAVVVGILIVGFINNAF